MRPCTSKCVAVHGRVAATQYHNLFAFHVDEVFRRLFKAQVAVDVGDQEGESTITNGGTGTQINGDDATANNSGKTTVDGKDSTGTEINGT